MTLKEFLEVKEEYVERAISLADMWPSDPVELKPELKYMENLDEIVERTRHLREKGLLDDDTVWRASVFFGTLLGEMVINEHGYHWILDENEVPMVEDDNNIKMSPITKIQKILLSSDEDGEGSPTSFYEGFRALQKYTAMSEEEKAKITTYIK